ncbi:MAG: cold shock domain-containing protein [Arachidicoccus sp.]|nr:cold shock domain-containing protein [Arachidicoccus sp.]
MAITTAKKENEKKKARAKQEKAQKMLERKLNAKKGKSLEEMMAYVDENGNLSSTPAGTSKQKVSRTSDEPKNNTRKGTLTSFNDAKGYGFIKDLLTGESIFVHSSNFKQLIEKADTVTFEIERSAKGSSAINVRKLM